MPDLGLAGIFTTLAKDFGLFVTLVVVLIWLLRDSIRWLSANIVIPVIAKHLKFIDDLNLSWGRFEDTITKIVETQDRLADTQEVILRKLDDMNPTVPRIRKPADTVVADS